MVPLCVHERDSVRLIALAREGEIVTWSLSKVEIASAIERRARERFLDESGRSAALLRLESLAAAWTEITALDAVRDRACRLLAVHELRAADAAQLAAATVAVAGDPAGCEFVCSDKRLAAAARREGFTLPV